MKIIECVPNVSEGRDHAVLESIADAVRAVDGVELLDMDPGAETNRTVFTFVGNPESIVEGAMALARAATARIDMQKHSGAHSRMGAVDVVPFVPVGGGATMDDCVEIAKIVGKRMADELEVPIYLYESAASRPERHSLAEVRKGEYEGLEAKLQDPEWKPDFGDARFNPRAGATVVGARPFLIAYNVNLNTAEKKLAHSIALDIREQGRFARDEQGKIKRDADGNKLRKAGLHQAVRAVGWYIPEFGRAQVSINLTNYEVSAPHEVFETIRDRARTQGMRVTGSELVGLIPLDALLRAGRFYLTEQGRTTGIPEPDVVAAARTSLGLDEVKPFDPSELVIDYRIAPRSQGLRALSVTEFCDELSRDTPAPGGGSVAALAGALSGALSAMVAALSYGGADDATRRDLQEVGERAQGIKDRLLRTIDEDASAFDGIVAARRMKKKTPEQQQAREEAIQRATAHAIDVPLRVVENAADLAELAETAARIGMESAASDAGSAAWCARSAAEAAALNVQINLPGLTDASAGENYRQRLAAALDRGRSACDRATQAVQKTIEASS